MAYGGHQTSHDTRWWIEREIQDIVRLVRHRREE